MKTVLIISILLALTCLTLCQDNLRKEDNFLQEEETKPVRMLTSGCTSPNAEGSGIGEGPENQCYVTAAVGVCVCPNPNVCPMYGYVCGLIDTRGSMNFVYEGVIYHPGTVLQ